MFSSIEEICKEFNIKNTVDLDLILKKLTEIQSSTHPDKTSNYDESKSETYNRATEAKEFVRGIQKEQNKNLITVNDALQMIQAFNQSNVPSLLEQSETKIEETYKEKIKQVKTSYLPQKISLGAISAIVSAIWISPTFLTENPLISNLIENNLTFRECFYSFLTLFWIIVLIASITMWIIIFARETYIKNILSDFKSNKFPQEIFSVFLNLVHNRKNSKNTFSQIELERYIENCLILNENELYFYEMDLRDDIDCNYDVDFIVEDTKRKYLRNFTKELSPKLAELIINRALEQEIIKKSNIKSWNIKYDIIPPDNH